MEAADAEVVYLIIAGGIICSSTIVEMEDDCKIFIVTR
jgi:hypothetical protein